VHGADHPYTAGVVCAKVARYAERIHHPNRLTEPLRRVGPKGSGQFAPISWDEALDRTAEAFLEAERRHGRRERLAHYYAGNDGSRHARRHRAPDPRQALFPLLRRRSASASRWPGFIAGTGKMRGVNADEIEKADCVVIWGTNAVATQVNLMTHATRARKQRGAKIVAIDIYDTETMRQADMALRVRPGSDGALACAVMHVAVPRRFCRSRLHGEIHRRARGPGGASRGPRSPLGGAITGLTVAEIEAFAALVGRNKRTFFRLGYGFSRQRNGAANMHAALCIPAVTGAWAHEGGGALHQAAAIYKLDKTLIEGLDARDESVRRLDPDASRRHADQRAGRAEGRRPGEGDADPEHQPDGCRARSGEGAARFCARRPVHRASTSSFSPTPRAWPTSCCRRRCSSSTTTSTPRAAINICSSRQNWSSRPRAAAPITR
jgi:anaerobic selenocysteine-containing dehydrogenase